jgi:DNA-binding MarR family transcriptional regulator
VIGASIAERIDQLVAAGHVARSPVPEDRRASLVSLTAAGQAVFDELLATVRATDAALNEGLSAADIATTRRVLVQLAERARTLRAERS